MIDSVIVAKKDTKDSNYCSSFLTLAATNSYSVKCRAITILSIIAKLYQATQESEKATMAFQVSKPIYSHNSRTKHYLANPKILTKSLTELILTCTSLIPEPLYQPRQTDRQTDTHTQKHSTPYIYLACACAPEA